MRNPAEVFLPQYFKTCFFEWRGIVLQRWNVRLSTFFLLRSSASFQRTTEKEEAVIHVDVDTNAPGCQQSEDVLRTIQLCFRTVAIPRRVHPKNQIETTEQFVRRFSQRRGKITDQRLVAGNVKFDFALLFFGKIVPAISPCRVDESRGKICSDGSFDVELFLLQHRCQVKKIHSCPTAEFQQL